MTGFDEDWYLERYPDVADSVKNGLIPSALEHFLRHGKEEGRLPTRPEPIVHVHIPKTAGSSVWVALQDAGRNIFAADEHFEFNPAVHSKFDVFTGHFGFSRAKSVGGELITVLRDPVDRFISSYYHLAHIFRIDAEITERTRIAATYPLGEFVTIFDCPSLIADLYNSMVWQIATGATVEERLGFRANNHVNDNELLTIAKRNLQTFSVVGFQNALDVFGERMQTRFGVRLHLGRHNENSDRPPLADISASIKHKVEKWVELDRELYEFARVEFG